MSKLVLSIVLALLAALNLLADSQGTVLKSPDGELAITFNIVEGGTAQAGSGQLVYSVTFHDKPIIEDSKLSLTLEGTRSLGENVQITASYSSGADRTYHLLTGKASMVCDCLPFSRQGCGLFFAFQ